MSMLKTNPSEYLLNTASQDKWERIGTCRRAGILAPLFLLYSQESIGVGDFHDLKLLVDWAKRTGNSIIQLLPMNEMGPLFCPYDSVSSFALEPMYISLKEIPLAKNKSIYKKLKDLKKLFRPGREYVDYAIKKEKMQLLWEIYLKEVPDNSLEFKEFREENAYWLLDFTLYKVVKDYHKGLPWYEWGTEFKNHSKRALESFEKEHEKELGFQMWLQWQLYKQLKDIRLYAKEKKVLLKGDLPILVSRDSADVWQYPEFFKLEYASGAPPDMYCAKGQRWGMPTYNWENIAADNFRHLKEKLKYAENFYDILRIDHVVGLFRIWSIPYNEPLENKGLNGSFDPKNENEWAGHGRDILSVMLKSTEMLLCAEDLGVIPKVCTETLKELGIPGNDVQRWVKDWKIKHDFLNPKDYRALSVAMLSTHDTTNWPACWENEAGTVDSDLFIRKCSDHRKINFNNVKERLFDLARSKQGRLRWLSRIDSVDKLVSILGKKKEELADFIELYQNSYQEKEKLWKLLKLPGPMREKSDPDILTAALRITLESSAIFCINTIIDWLYLTNIFKGDPYRYRINTPGTINAKNWSLTLPFSLEELLKHKVNKKIRALIISSGRI
jgi:4-alpha-glucanotransferase